MNYFTKKTILDSWNTILLISQSACDCNDVCMLESSYHLLLDIKIKAEQLYGGRYSDQLHIPEKIILKLASLDID